MEEKRGVKAARKMTLSISSVTTIEECRQIEDLQIHIWNTKLLDTIPDHLLITIAKNCGSVLLARWNDKPVGFAMAFLAETEDGRRKLASHMLGVQPACQRRNIGYQLKLAQRQVALNQGVELITWTFDPLVSVNAHFNMGKLGAISNTYFRSLYGDMRSALNAGLPSDRLEAAWWLNSAHVQTKLSAAQPSISPDEALVLNPSPAGPNEHPTATNALRPLRESRHFVRIPPNIEALKAEDTPLSLAWQRQIRRLLEDAFAAGYFIADFIRLATKNESYYVLQRGER
ncbi:MAG TPA: GNAT family N-acetyltransferase [Chloroflexi bacterium]|nr:GNAT family N-acetyltransferase [Chloroflexota bacterium]